MAGETLVVGGGLIGLTAALALAEQGWQVTVIEPDADRAAASWGNAGHVAIEQVEPLASWKAIRSAPRRLFSRGGALALPPGQWRSWAPFLGGLASAAAPARFARGRDALASLLAGAMPAWRRLAVRLPGEPLLLEEGHLVAWESAATARAGRAAWTVADTGPARLREGDAAERERLGQVAPAVVGAIRFENTGQIADLRLLAGGLEAALIRAGGRIERGRALLTRDGNAARVSIDGGPPRAPALVVLAAGVRSGRLIAPIGHRAPLIAERGYHIRSADHDWPDDLPPVVFEDRSIIVTRYRDSVQVASIVELGDPDAPPDPAKWLRLEAHVAQLGLPIRGPFVRWMGSRPTLPDYLPAIGRSRLAPNLLYAFGHQHLGLTLAPLTAELVAAVAAGDVPAIDLAPFSIDRFKGRRFG